MGDPVKMCLNVCEEADLSKKEMKLCTSACKATPEMCHAICDESGLSKKDAKGCHQLCDDTENGNFEPEEPETDYPITDMCLDACENSGLSKKMMKACIKSCDKVDIYNPLEMCLEGCSGLSKKKAGKCSKACENATKPAKDKKSKKKSK